MGVFDHHLSEQETSAKRKEVTIPRYMYARVVSIWPINVTQETSVITCRFIISFISEVYSALSKATINENKVRVKGEELAKEANHFVPAFLGREVR